MKPKIVVFEGNATSGKSILQQKLADVLRAQGKKVFVVDEKVITKSFISDKTRNVKGSIALLNSIIEEYFSRNFDYIIFDRFHFTHVTTLKSTLSAFKDIERKLQDYDISIIYLYYDPKSIITRIRTAAGRRTFLDPGYINHLKRIFAGAKTTKEEDEKIEEYYTVRLARYADVIKKSRLPVLKIDVSKLLEPDDYDSLLPQIQRFLNI